jgi:hypothetical protein
MDFVVQLPKTKRGFDAIVVFVEKLTKRAYFCPTTTDATAPDVANIFFNNIFKNHGLPKVIVSDRDPKFTSKFWKSLFGKLGTKLAMSTSFHPQTDGQTERMNRTLEEMLRAFVNYKQNNWDELLPALEFAYNNSKNASTNYTPFVLDTGQNPHTPLSILSPTTPTYVAITDEFLEKWQITMKMAIDHLREAQERQKKYADQNRRDEIFEVGNKVLLSSVKINDPAQTNRPKKKLEPRYFGPFEVEQVVSPVAYKLKLPSTLKIHPVIHISFLKRYHESTSDFTRPIPPPPVIINEEPEYEVERILDTKLLRRKRYYLIKWKGYPLYDATWEPAKNLVNASELIKEFNQRGR